MYDALVANASSLILLSKVSGLDWLTRLATRHVIVPTAVLSEIEVGPGGEELSADLHKLGSFRLEPDTTVPATVSAWDLGLGETQVLAHSHAQQAAAVLDDRLARDCARSLDIPLIGTLGIVLAAKRLGWIETARPIVQELLRKGLYLHPDLVTRALAEVDE